MNNKILFSWTFYVLITGLSLPIYSSYDATIVGCMLFAESLGGISASIIDCLHTHMRVNFIPTHEHINFEDTPRHIKAIALHPNKTPANIALLTDLLWDTGRTCAHHIPTSCIIKIAYSMVETTRIPSQWVDLLNKEFDAVVVPDEWLIPVYAQSGVIIPIFVIPCIVYLEEFFSRPIKIQPHYPFVFGVTAGLWERKNFERLIKAFGQVFGNNLNVKLRIHARAGDDELKQSIVSLLKELNYQNIEFINKRFNRAQYLDFMSTLDCYVLVSKGEGFSITPREAMALGLPCVLSDTAAHKTICNTNLVSRVKAEIAEPAYIKQLGGYCGQQFNCSLYAVKQALKDIYDNYDKHIQQSSARRQWVAQYTKEGLQVRYKMLFKPKKIVLGPSNIINNNYLMTNSKKLYNKYIHILKH